MKLGRAGYTCKIYGVHISMLPLIVLVNGYEVLQKSQKRPFERAVRLSERRNSMCGIAFGEFARIARQNQSFLRKNRGGPGVAAGQRGRQLSAINF